MVFHVLPASHRLCDIFICGSSNFFRGKIFDDFSDPQDANDARYSLNGREFLSWVGAKLGTWGMWLQIAASASPLMAARLHLSWHSPNPAEWEPCGTGALLISDGGRHSSNFASYEQQDAHEFFISVLDRIHEKEQPILSNKGIGGDCHCIAHRVFSGVLRSDVTCTICGFTSTTYDPCVDISLDLEPSIGNTAASVNTVKQKQNPTTSSLVTCLDLFTRPEKLGSDQKLYCEHCQVRQDSVKQMSIRRLPLVLCFHIKRFEHSLILKTSKKIDQYLNFPLSLDMTPYLSSSIIRKRFGSRIFAFEGDESEMSGKLSSEFEVFAVVSHIGRLDSGHYVTFLRLRNQWYKCDDAWITQVSEGVVKASQGYMIYYVQKVL